MKLKEKNQKSPPVWILLWQILKHSSLLGTFDVKICGKSPRENPSTQSHRTVAERHTKKRSILLGAWKRVSFHCIHYCIDIIRWHRIFDILWYIIVQTSFLYNVLVKYDTCDITWWALNTHDRVLCFKPEIKSNFCVCTSSNPIMGVQRSSGNVTCIVLDSKHCIKMKFEQ